MRAASARSTPAQGAPPLSLGHLAHELNSLLDGSLRNLALVQQQLSSHRSASADALRRLDVASDGLRQMAAMLERIMRAPAPALDLFDEQRPIALEVERLVAGLSALCETSAVQLAVQIDDGAAVVPIGKLGAVILNGLRNAIAAAAASPRLPRLVTLTIGRASEVVSVCMRDTGPGLGGKDASRQTDKQSPHGHGFGLDLCRQIIQEMDGTMSLTNTVRQACVVGACFTIRVPVRSLLNHE